MSKGKGGILFKAESWGHVKRKLVTHEDKFYMHKIMGVLSILSAIYRFAYVYNQTGELGFVDGDWTDWVTIFIHMGPALTSLIFVVPARRMEKNPMVIYEEYRQHAIVFSLRALTVFLFAKLFPDTPYKWIFQYCFVMAHHVVVDDITRRWGVEGMSAVRADKSRPNDKDMSHSIKRSYSLFQFLALGAHLIPHAVSSDLSWTPLIAVQSSAFFMTLYRKGIIRFRFHFITYTACLMICGFHIVRIAGDVFALIITFAFFLRVNFHVNKYALWFIFAMMWNFLNESTDVLDFPLANAVGFPSGYLRLFILPLCSLNVFLNRGWEKLDPSVKESLGYVILSPHSPATGYQF